MTKHLALLVGVFGAAQGTRGEIRIKSFTADPEAIGRYGDLTAEDGRRFRLLALRRVKDDMLVARVDGVKDRNAAEALTHLRLFVARDALPDAGDDEFYHADLVGLTAQTMDGRGLGVVMGVENYGGGDLLEIRPPFGETILVPFTRAFVPTIDLAAGRLLVAPAALGVDESESDG